MSGGTDPRWDDPRDRDDESRDVKVHWIELGRGPASDRQSEDDARGRDDNERDRARAYNSRERGHDPRDVFLEGLELPRGLEREVVLDRVTATSSMARRAVRSPQRAPSGSCPSETCAIHGRCRLRPATTISVTCEAKG
jgi:hypothetical protein